MQFAIFISLSIFKRSRILLFLNCLKLFEPYLERDGRGGGGDGGLAGGGG